MSLSTGPAFSGLFGYFSSYGAGMPFESFAHVPLPESVLAHIWEGEPGDLNQGGHRHGLGREGKTEFPEHWSLEMVFSAVRATLDRPHTVVFLRQQIFIMRVVAGVIVEVDIAISKGVWEVRTAFPRCGDGVHLNIRGKAVAMPLDMTILEV